MSLDDDDIPTAAPAAATASADPGAELGMTADDALEEQPQDFRNFTSQFRKSTHISAQTIRRGEKDFEAHGTRLQDNALEQSRQAMTEVLSYTRVHTQQNWTRAWYFPDWWTDYVEEEEDEEQKQSQTEKKPYAHVRDRVVVVESSSVASQNLGRAITGQAKDRPARGKDWLLPEEALYLLERGSLDLWWPTRGMEEVFSAEAPAAKGEGNDLLAESDAAPVITDEVDEYEMGFPLSVQAAYSLLIGNDGERGKVSLQKFQVYSNLKRAGYNVLRNINNHILALAILPPHPLTTHLPLPPHPYGPLLQPGLYRSYNPIYRQLALLPRHKPSALPSSPWQPADPFAVHYYVWKSSQKWSKTRQPPPDFFLAVVDAQQTAVPSLEEIAALLDATPAAPARPEWAGPGRLYARLKHGHRNVLVAVVDHGVINYMRFAEGAFGEEELFGRRYEKGSFGQLRAAHVACGEAADSDRELTLFEILMLHLAATLGWDGRAGGRFGLVSYLDGAIRQQ
ncbi:hypothetical protein B0T17DRAFT_622493 [Bombardia bombarda]|uniref:tRNA-splicing endonuclease subunit Sen54 N-terminal domain-containing protein n=1 Tax=Bombardia bombarda TaxID=252184 RepID=A0AA39XKB3_9PEZI|nr:hypothetical protein B0T17DRAFT_622493 [Bombardia bombarda]